MEQEEVGVDTDWSLPTLGVRSLSANVGYCLIRKLHLVSDCLTLLFPPTVLGGHPFSCASPSHRLYTP